MPSWVARLVSVGELARSPRPPPPLRGLRDLRQPEVQDLDRAVVADFDVLRFEIAMDDALLVRGFEGVGDLTGDREGVGSGRAERRDRASDRSSPATSSITSVLASTP